MMFAGVKEALRMGSKIAFWVGGFFILEGVIDNGRQGRKDFLSTTGAGLTTAGVFSLWSEYNDGGKGMSIMS